MIQSEKLPQGTIAEVCKRDGRVVAFDKSRIAESIYRAEKTAGCEEQHMASELAEVITLFLYSNYAGETPSIDKIQDAVEKVLAETGHTRTAHAFRSYRHERNKKRGMLEVSKAPEASVSDVPLVDASGKEEIGPWDRVRIAGALEKEAHMESEMAREVARAIEQKVFSAGIKRLSTSLIRALVDNELFERGLSVYRRRQRLLGVPTYDVERLIMSDPKNAPEKIAETVMRQFTLDAIFSLDVSHAHLEACIHISGVEDPACASEDKKQLFFENMDEEELHDECMTAMEWRPTSFVFDTADEYGKAFRLPPVTVNLIAAEQEAPRGRSDLCLAIEQVIATAARAQGQRANFVHKASKDDARLLGPIGFAGLNECAAARDEDAARLVPWIRQCVAAQHHRGVKLMLTTESRGSTRFMKRGAAMYPSEGLGISGTPLQRLYALDEFTTLFDERVLQVRRDEMQDVEALVCLLGEVARLGSVHSVTVSGA